MGSKLAVAVVASFLAAPWSAASLVAQARSVVVPPLLALSLNGLDFGTLLRGVPASVGALDARRAGLFEIQGPPGTSVRVELALPAAMSASGGALLPLSFGPRDGYADLSRGWPPQGSAFDPHAPVIGSLGSDGRLYLRLGGTALPERSQAGGDYRATVFMTVYDLGM